MKVQWIVPVCAALVAAPLVAQQQPAPAPMPRGSVRMDPPPAERYMNLLVNRRGRLGVSVNLRATPTDSIGALVESVTPGGPAAKAGLRSGDVITRLDGQALTDRINVRVGADQSFHGLRLIELAARLSPNDTVSVELRRGKDRKTVKVVTSGDDGSNGFAFTMRSPGTTVWRTDTTFQRMLPLTRGMTEPMMMTDIERLDPAGASRYRVFFGSPLGNLELAPLNDDLGSYFGTTEGVLVINVPKESKLGLKGGDVILSVDGRKPTGPAHLMRILQSYDGAESFRIEVMRNRRRETLTARLGEKG